MDVRRSVADPLFDARVNIVGTIDLLEAAREGRRPKVLFASSGGAAYGEQETFPAPRDAPHEAASAPTASASARASATCSSTRPSTGCRSSRFRYANVYGPRQDPHGEAGVVAIFCGKLLRGEPPTINGDGKQTRDYVFVGDWRARTCWRSSSDATGPVNIGTGARDRRRTRSAATMLVGSSGGKPPGPQHGPAKAGEQRRSVDRIRLRRRARSAGTPQVVALREGLARTYELASGARRRRGRTGALENGAARRRCESAARW